MRTTPCLSRPAPLAAALVLLAALALAACGTPASAAAPPAPLEKLRVQLNWSHSIDWGGLYIAQADGHYAAQGLEVQLQPGGYDAEGDYIDSVSQVIAGEAEFGITTGATLIQANLRATPLVAITTIYQRQPLAFTSLAERRITRPQDLLGKVVQVSPDNLLLFHALLADQGIDPAQVVIADRTDASLEPLLRGEADVIDGWVTNEPVALERSGRAFNSILIDDYGIGEYPNVIFTTRALIEQRPELVERFLRATLAGLRRMVEQPQHAVELTIQHNTALNPAALRQSIYHALPLMNPPGSQVGMMRAATWQQTVETMRAQGAVPGTLDATTVYTLAFLERIYKDS